MESHPWPGNVRELRNVVERAVYRWDDWSEPIAHVVFDPFDSPWQVDSVPQLANGQRNALDAAPSAAPMAPAPAPASSSDFSHVDDLRGAVDAHEKKIVEYALGRHRWNQRQTAKALGLSYDQLRHCLKKHGITNTSEN